MTTPEHPAPAPAAPQPGPGSPSSPAPRPVPSPTTAPAFTELTTRRLGPLRAYFVRHPVVMDLIVMAWFGIPALLQALVIGVDVPGLELGRGQILTALAATLVATGVLWWRRRTPLVTLVIVTALAGLSALVTFSSNGLELAVAFCVYAVAASSGIRRTWVAFLGATLVLCASNWWSGANLSSLEITSDDGTVVSPLTYQITGVTLVLLFNLVALAIGTSVHNRREHVRTLMDRGNQLALERDQREQLAVADERTRIARELHDVVAHSLTVMITLSDGAAGIVGRDPERAASTMRDVSETGRAALADMRRVVGALRDGDDADPFTPAPTQGVDDLVARFTSAGLPVTYTRGGPDLPTDTGLRLAVYRIVQEALTNVLRYAPLSPAIDVCVTRDTHQVEVEVLNSRGPGVSAPVEGSGRGLIGMRERVAVFGGSLEAGPTPRGWRVHAVLPWEDAA